MKQDIAANNDEFVKKCGFGIFLAYFLVIFAPKPQFLDETNKYNRDIKHYLLRRIK